MRMNISKSKSKHFQINLSKSQSFTFMFQTGEQIGDVDLITRFKMEDLANVTQIMRMAHAVPHQAGVVTVKHTATVLDALTSEVMIYWQQMCLPVTTNKKNY